MDPATLATTVVTSFLLPYAKKGAGKMAEAVGEKFGKAAADKIAELGKGVWDCVTELFHSGDELTTLNLFEKQPELFSAPVGKMLEQKLRDNPKAAEKLETLINSPVAGSSTGASIMGAVVAGIVDLRQATISGSGNVFTGVHVGNLGEIGRDMTSGPSQSTEPNTPKK